MKALFVHDHKFYQNNDVYYSPGGLPSSAWSRYLTNNIEQLFVVSRGARESEPSGLIKTSRENVFFDPVYEVKGGIDYYRYASIIKKRLKKHIENVDFVIIRTPSSFGNYAYKICQKLNKPYIIEVVGCVYDSHWNYGNLGGKILAPLKYIKMRRLVKDSFAALYVTQYYLQKRYPTQAQITSFASNVQIPELIESVRRDHINFLKKNDRHLMMKIGMIGNISVKYKGFSIAFKSLQKFKKNCPEIKFKFFIVGAGESIYIDSLIKDFSLENEVVLLGRVEAGNGVFNFLDNLDLYIQPSLTEGLPRAVIEAMSRACPVLASNVGGIPELIDEKYLHSPGDDHKLYVDMKKVLSSLEERILMANTNFERSGQYVEEILDKRRIDFYKKAFKEIKLLEK